MPLGVEVIDKHINISVQKRETNLHYGKYSQKGADGADAVSSLFNYHHIQSVPATVWTFNHNLGRVITSVKIIDSDNRAWNALSITDIDLNNCSVLVGNAAFSGELFAI